MKVPEMTINELLEILLCLRDPMDQGFNTISIHFYENISCLASMAVCYKGNQISTVVCSGGALAS